MNINDAGTVGSLAEAKLGSALHQVLTDSIHT